MFCSACGKKIDDDARFCPYCGASVITPASWSSEKPKIQTTGYESMQPQYQTQQPQPAQPTNQTQQPQPAQPTNQAQQPQPAQPTNRTQQPQFTQPPHQSQQSQPKTVQNIPQKSSFSPVVIGLGAAIFVLVGVAGFFGYRAFVAFREGSEPGFVDGPVLGPDDELEVLKRGSDDGTSSNPGNEGEVEGGTPEISANVQNDGNFGVDESPNEISAEINGQITGSESSEDGQNTQYGNSGTQTAEISATDGIASSTSYNYSIDELCDMALDYYEAKKGIRLDKAEGIDNNDGTVSIHLTGTANGVNTSMWYRVDMNTATGVDELRETKVDLNDHTAEIPSTQEKTDKKSSTFSADDFVLPDSSTRLYTKAELSHLSKDELRLARNEIFARHGRKFRDKELQAYFNSMSWYKGEYEPEEFDKNLKERLNDTEIKNLDIIKELEKN